MKPRQGKLEVFAHIWLVSHEQAGLGLGPGSGSWVPGTEVGLKDGAG